MPWICEVSWRLKVGTVNPDDVNRKLDFLTDYTEALFLLQLQRLSRRVWA